MKAHPKDGAEVHAVLVWLCTQVHTLGRRAEIALATHTLPAENTFLLYFSYIYPEPVLVKRSFLRTQRRKRRFPDRLLR
jgi:hypothetical protein